MENVVIGVDYSSTNTGIVILDTFGEYLCSFLISPKNKSFDKRIIEIKNILFKILDDINNTKIIGIESPSFFSKGKTIDLAAGYGYIKYSLIDKGIDVQCFTPSTIKKFSTGNGRADKEDMYNALPDDVKEDLLSSSYKKIDDVVDAYWIAKLAFITIKNKD